MNRPTDPDLPDWHGFHHTHDVCYRQQVFPVMARVVEGASVMFRSDGLVEWLKLPGRVGWLFRGTPIGSGVGLREIGDSSTRSLEQVIERRSLVHAKAGE